MCNWDLSYGVFQDDFLKKISHFLKVYVKKIW